MHPKESVCKRWCSSLKIHRFSDWLEQHVQNTASPLSAWQKAVTFEKRWYWWQVTACESLAVDMTSCCFVFCGGSGLMPESFPWGFVCVLMVSTLRTCNQRPEVMLQLTALYLVSSESYSPARFIVLSHFHLSILQKKTSIYRQMFLIHLQKKNNKNNHKCFIQSRQWFCLSPWTSHGLSILGEEKLGRWLWKTAQDSFCSRWSSLWRCSTSPASEKKKQKTRRHVAQQSPVVVRGVWLISTGSHIMSGLLGPVKSNHSSTYCKVIVRVLKVIYFIVAKIVSALEKHL